MEGKTYQLRGRIHNHLIHKRWETAMVRDSSGQPQAGDRTSSLVMGDLSLRSSDAATDSYHIANQGVGSCLGAMHLRCWG